jgi:AraC-like DNA-binding protein
MSKPGAAAGSPAEFTLRVTPGSSGEFDLWKNAVAPMFEIGALSPLERAAFDMHTKGYFFPGMAITKTTSSGCSFERPRSLIAKSGIDNIMVQAYVAGSYLLTTEGVATEVRTGDLVVFDLTRECAIHAKPYTNISLTMQRELLTPLIVDMGRLHGVVLRDGEPRNILLRSHMELMHSAAAKIGMAEQTALVQGTAALFAACVGPSLEGRTGGASNAAMTTLQSIRRFIDSRLDDLEMGPESLAEQFALSRASIYRLFEPLGGVRSYIQQRRLMHAYQIISNPSHFDESIASIAGKLGFAESTAFSRAFRGLYHMTPSDVRAAAKSGFQSPKQGEPSLDGSYMMLNRWLLGLDANG